MTEHDPPGACRCAPLSQDVDSKIADLNNAPDGGMAGAITAALYLQEFVPPSIPWVHIEDIPPGPPTSRGRPGGALALRALFQMA